MMGRRENIIAALDPLEFQCDPRKHRWVRSGAAVDRDDAILTMLVRRGKSIHIPNAGVWGGKALNKAEIMPEFTTRAFRDRRMVRDRNARTPMKTLYSAFGEFVGLPRDDGDSDAEFTAKHGTDAGEFRKSLAKMGICTGSKRLRILGVLCRNVFFGWKLRDVTADEVDAELKSLPPAETAEVLPEPELADDDPNREYVVMDRGRRRRMTQAQIDERKHQIDTQRLMSAKVDFLDKYSRFPNEAEIAHYCETGHWPNE